MIVVGEMVWDVVRRCRWLLHSVDGEGGLLRVIVIIFLLIGWW